MAGLQRSAVSFRRQGSSGFVWDDRFLSEEINKAAASAAANNQNQNQNQTEDKPPDDVTKDALHAPPPINTVQRTRSNGGGRAYRTGKVSPAIEPPSPKLSACGFCAAFAKTGDKPHPTKKPAKHRSR